MITCRPADLIKPEFEKCKLEIGDLARCDEDVLSYALFPQVAKKFLENRAASEKKQADENIVKTLYVEDMTR